MFRKSKTVTGEAKAFADGKSFSVLNKSLKDNIIKFKELFRDDVTVIYHEFEVGESGVKCCIIFINGMVDNRVIDENIVKPVILAKLPEDKKNLIDVMSSSVIQCNDIEKSAETHKLVEKMLYGDTIFLLDGAKEGLAISTKGFKVRAIEEPTIERVFSGPREGFNENIMINLSMIRRKLLTDKLKFKIREFGDLAHTKAAVCYIDGVVNTELLEEFERRLDAVKADGLLDSNHIYEMIKDQPYALFATLSKTERPDVIAAKLLEGKVALIVDGSPVALSAPFLFIDYFMNNDDYYQPFFIGSFARILRFIGFFISISVPAIYLSLVAFHQELLPTQLLYSISMARHGVPFPSVFEILGLVLALELLIESGVRMSSNIGQALSIVGAVVIGQSAVEAKLISAPLVIIVAIAGITGLLIPHMRTPISLLRFILVCLSALMGLFGFLVGIAGIIIHLCSIYSFELPYTLYSSPVNLSGIKDNLVRVSWLNMGANRQLPIYEKEKKIKKGEGQ